MLHLKTQVSPGSLSLHHRSHCIACQSPGVITNGVLNELILVKVVGNQHVKLLQGLWLPSLEPSPSPPRQGRPSQDINPLSIATSISEVGFSHFSHQRVGLLYCINCSHGGFLPRSPPHTASAAKPPTGQASFSLISKRAAEHSCTH